MQLIHSDQQCVLTSKSSSEQCQQTLALEKAQDETVLLREQINSLQQYLSEQLQQQQVIEQELDKTNQELELMNTEIQLMAEAKWLFFEEIKEFMKMLPGDGEVSRMALLKLFRKFYNEIDVSKELEPVRLTSSGKR
ncbi:hypothetical protein [Pseudanabaena sp. FACHB-2040]|uniref:hypothetical protein n=1 Tax=Pseudanabaena sp. FACHB-2040 TaxID=2692859 RepID=UPI001689BBA1|nr:hypothetical protein [Pseudanabaena sp. FACHB-2040]MBD2261225.1 hypothetical protein [Pseudanabaena sp. FACHB-2040]